jgi:UDPglucose 6-dehydrogenase|tara:strand:- start:279 stop:1169 length:891 start_codon:yes stop_codon:yes gene_type:complete
MKIGIVGNGFVGASVAFGFSSQTGCDGAEVRIYDKDPTKSLCTLVETICESDFIFLSVPTPSNKDGSINIDIVDSALNDISEIVDENKQVFELSLRAKSVVLLRSTVTPGTTAKLQKKYKNLNIVFNPEFLTERSAKFDFINQSRFILGGDDYCVDKVEELFKWRFGETTPIIKTNYETAELIKYMGNCYFATKVSFLNEMRQIADRCGVDWDKAIEGFVRDGRIGHSHLAVPGPDGRFGFGGSCFPKDIQAIINFAEELGVEPDVLKGVWNKNLEVRSERDWENLKGRSVIDETD